jgi:8-oxo-dGTP diphosphatase
MKIVGKIWRKMPAPLRKKIVRATQKKFTASVAAIIQNEKGEVLLLDHVLRPASGWGIPGGFLDFGEQPTDAVKRELREETGLELKELKIFRVRTIGRHIEIIFSAEAIGEASVKSREISGLGWFKLEEMPEKMSRIQKTVIEDLLRNNL